MKLYEPILVPWRKLQLYPGNPRDVSYKDLADIRNALLRWGLVNYQTVWMPDLIILGGNQRQLAMQQMASQGEPMPDQLWVVPFEGDAAEAALLNIALNKINAAFDPVKLAAMMADLAVRVNAGELTRTGFDEFEIAALVKQTEAEAQSVLKAATDAFALVGDNPSIREVRAALLRGGMDLQAADYLAPIYVATGQAPDWQQRQASPENQREPTPDAEGNTTVRIQISPDVNLRYKTLMLSMPGDTDEAKFDELLTRAQHMLETQV